MRILLVLFCTQAVTSHLHPSLSKKDHVKDLLLKPAGGGLILKIPGREYNKGIKSVTQKKREIIRKNTSINNNQVQQRRQNPKFSHKGIRLKNPRLSSEILGSQGNRTPKENAIKSKYIMKKSGIFVSKEMNNALKKKRKRKDRVRKKLKTKDQRMMEMRNKASN